MLIKVLIIVFALFVISRILMRYRRGELSSSETIFWCTFWLLIIGATLSPRTTDEIARYVGVERGADLLVYLSVIFLFFLVFKIFVQIHKIEQDITKIIRKIALEETEQKEKDSQKR